MSTTVHDQRLQTVSLMAIGAIACGAALFWLKPVLLPLTLSVVIHLGVSPVVDWMMARMRMPRMMAVGL